jgi:maltose-binding protein MalE
VRLADSKSSPVNFNFWEPSGDALGTRTMLQLTHSYNQRVGPTSGIHVLESDVSASSNYLKFTEALTTFTSTSPDLVMTYGYIPVVQWAASGLVYPLDKLAAQLGFKKQDFYPFVWDMQYFAGHTWNIVQEYDADLLYQNKQVHAGPPPTTIGQLDALSEHYTEFDKNGDLKQVGVVPWDEGGFSSGGYGTWGVIWGAEFYDNHNLKWTITKPQNRRFLEWYLKYVHMMGGIGKINKLTSSVPPLYGSAIGQAYLFNYGLSAFGLLGEYYPLELRAAVGEKAASKLHYEISPNLLSAEGINSGKMEMIVSTDSFVIPQRSRYPQAAAELTKWFMNPAQLVTYCEKFGQGMPTPALATDPAYLRACPWMAHWAKAAAAGWYTGQPPSPVFGTFDTAMGVAIQGLTGGKYTPAQALSYVDNQVSQAVTQFRQANPQWNGE